MEILSNSDEKVDVIFGIAWKRSADCRSVGDVSTNSSRSGKLPGKQRSEVAYTHSERFEHSGDRSLSDAVVSIHHVFQVSVFAL